MTVGGEQQQAVLLIEAEWRARTLILAELEGSYEVVALPGLRFALPALTSGVVRPALVILDVTQEPDAQLQQVEQLLRLLEAPLLLLVGVYSAGTFAALRGRVAAWLTRPLRVEEVVARVRRLLPTTTDGP